MPRRWPPNPCVRPLTLWGVDPMPATFDDLGIMVRIVDAGLPTETVFFRRGRPTLRAESDVPMYWFSGDVWRDCPQLLEIMWELFELRPRLYLRHVDVLGCT